MRFKPEQLRNIAAKFERDTKKLLKDIGLEMKFSEISSEEDEHDKEKHRD